MAENPVEMCPDSPNCVSTTDTREARFVKPISFECSALDALYILKTVLNDMEGARLVGKNGYEVQVEFHTKWFNFVDDGVFFVDEDAKKIHMRSASRVGYWDLGANRKRLERVREMFEARTKDR